MKTIAFFPEAAFGPALNSVGIAQQVEKLGHKAVFICDKGFFELDYFIAACHSVKTFTIRLVNARGGDVYLNGHDWSFSLIFQELP